ncbi:MAG: bifunctional (p)ppGpp synthetase/guanosine-3',5'-bis(diphosphate) 3'-pyrophosphohydrolase [Wenzhouxiangellaceae bacterium]|nr:bifunctional (p)ppGpp synthetase/guanosine-3',5'-bis(diphosphate) 3'-pyrophosphohydrolase [Wenzhouxiangellaceae bacterium]
MTRKTAPTLDRLITRFPERIGADSEIGRRLDELRDRDDTQAEMARRMLRALQPLSPDRTTVLAALDIALEWSAAGDRHSGDDGGVAAAPARDDEASGLLEQFQRVVRFDRRYLPESAGRAEGLRRLILALIADVRVVLLVLAWQLARMQLAHDDETRRALARETRAIHAPLANRLGIFQLKWPLEDLAFRYLEPEACARIERLVAERRDERERFVGEFIRELDDRLDEAGIAHETSGRAKHIYSIWRKMQRKGLDFHELFDIRAVRVLVETVADCYAVLGLVHSHWQPVPGEFDDYISNPKPNLYRSLHTAVRGREGRVFEVQIRTREMHEHAELGVAAHWRYKEGGPRDEALEQRIGVMRQLIEAADDELDDQALLENFESLTSEDRVYVLTPKGDVIDLARGATALDFAYHVHTEVGHRCRGAKVNGRIVPLNHVLANGDRVEVLTRKQPQPSRDWLNRELGYLKSGRARSKVRHWFRELAFDDNLAAGRESVEAELKRLDLADADLDPIARQYHFAKVDEMLAAVGAGDMTAAQVAQAAMRQHAESTPAAAELPLRRRGEGAAEPPDGEIRIEGVGNLVHQLARCCRPLPGDPIAGFITRTRGVTVHRDDCRQYLRQAERQPERRIRVEWGRRQEARYPVRIRIEAWDRKDLIKDIGSVLSSHGLGVTEMKAGRGEQPEAVEIELEIEVGDLDQLSAVLGRLSSTENVSSVRRVR